MFLAEDISLEPMTVTQLHMQVAEGPKQWEEVNLLVEEMSMGHCLKATCVTCLPWQDGQSPAWLISLITASTDKGTPVGAEEVKSN